MNSILLVTLSILRFIRGQTNVFILSECFQNGIIRDIAFNGASPDECLFWKLNYKKTIPNIIANQKCDEIYANDTTFMQQTRCSKNLPSRDCLRSFKMDVILFEKEFVLLEFNNSQCILEKLGFVLIRFESFATSGLVCDLSDTFACLGLFSDTGYNIECPFSRDKFGLSLRGTDKNQFCKNPYFTTTKFKRMPVTSNENNCTVAFNVTALANRRKITVILHMISKDRSKSQMDILKRDGRQQTLTFSFPFLDDKLLQYYLRAVIWLDIELFDEILFAGVSMSPGCFRVSLTKETTTNEVRKESTSTKLQRNITEKLVTGDLSKLMNKSAKVSLTKGTTINEVRKESTSTELQRNITEKLVTGDLSKLMNKSATGNPNEDTNGRNSNKVTVGDIVLIIVTVALVSALIFGTTFKFLRYHKNKTVEVKTSAVCDVISGTGFIEDNICNSNPNYSWYRSSWITGRINNFHFKDLKMFEEIGNGHFGLVRRGKILSTSTPVALKELKPCSTAVEKMDFLLEAITLCKLKHSNIVRCFGISTSQQHICILLELMDGDLKNYLRKNRDLGACMATVFSLTHSLKLAIDVCRACVYLEAIKFIHRDIAARNCLILNREGQVVVKIADFGMARDVTMTQYYVKEGACKVPVRWMSPESMLNGRFSSKTDIWAFGVLMWEIYTGARLPYGDFTIDAVMSHIIQGGKLDKPAKCSDDVWQIMQMCWLDCADERPSFRDLEKSLQTCLNTGDEQESEGNTEDTILL